MSRWIGSFLVLFCFACSGKNNLPSGVLERERMEKVMWDMIQADQYYREYILKDSSSRDVSQDRYQLYEKVLKLHKISKNTFDKSYSYYSSHPNLMKDVFDSLSAKGNRKLQDLYKPSVDAVDTSSRLKRRLLPDSLKVK